MSVRRLSGGIVPYHGLQRTRLSGKKNAFSHTFSNKFRIFEQFDEKQLKIDGSHSTKKRNQTTDEKRYHR